MTLYRQKAVKGFFRRFILIAWLCQIFGIPEKVTYEKVTSDDADNMGRSLRDSSSEFNENYLVDIRGSYAFGHGDQNPQVMWTEPSEQADTPYRTASSKRPPLKQVVKPIDILNELEIPPRDIDVLALDSKIQILNIKKELVTQKYTKRDIEGLLERMENRKKYLQYKSFFSKFNTTTDAKIQELLGKYTLVIKPVDIFVPELPDEVILVMREYQDKTLEMCGKKPIMLVIATAESFSDFYKKRDPIILAQSPFWFGYDILGAYDKEMLLLSEL